MKSADNNAASENGANVNKKKNMDSPEKIAWRRLKKNKLAMIGLVFLCCMILLCIIGPIVSPYHDITATNMAISKKAPNAAHWFGTDTNGRDVFTRLLYGGRISILVGFAATFLSIFAGSVLGCTSAYYGGRTDFIIMRIVDIVESLPSLPILIMLSAMMSDLKVRTNVRIYYMMFILAALSWAGICRFIRGQVLAVRDMEYMTAAESLGISDIHKIFRHIMPNVFPIIIVMGTLSIGDMIITESTMSFLGVGVLPPQASWGQMVSDGTNLMNFKLRPWLWMPAGFCILLTVLAVNLLGDGLRDAIDPKNTR